MDASLLQIESEPLASLRLFVDESRSPSSNMAMDEALLIKGLHPSLRFYGWSVPTVSIGYFCALSAARARHGDGFEYIRRYTGGGTVEHGGGDTTYALAVPANCHWGRMRASDLYRRVHTALAEALHACGIETESSRKTADSHGGACFQNPVSTDLLHQGQKIAGAAIRRCTRGVLLQGSIQKVDLPAELPLVFARMLALHVEEWHPGACMDKAVAALVSSRYGRNDWTARK